MQQGVQTAQRVTSNNVELVCEQALRGALAAVRETERELATASLKFEYLHGKSRCTMLIGGNNISYDVITPWHVFFNVCLRSRSFPLLADWRKSDSSVDMEQQGYWRWIKFQRRSCKLSFLFPPRRQSALESLLSD